MNLLGVGPERSDEECVQLHTTQTQDAAGAWRQGPRCADRRRKTSALDDARASAL
jgi:hypothetical protein